MSAYSTDLLKSIRSAEFDAAADEAESRVDAQPLSFTPSAPPIRDDWSRPTTPAPGGASSPSLQAQGLRFPSLDELQAAPGDFVRRAGDTASGAVQGAQQAATSALSSVKLPSLSELSWNGGESSSPSPTALSAPVDAPRSDDGIQLPDVKNLLWEPSQPATSSQPSPGGPQRAFAPADADGGIELQIDRSSPDAFLQSFVPAAQTALRAKGLPTTLAPILAAIPMNEQGWQREAPGNNYYGIKGSNPRTGANTGPVGTWEDYGQGRQNIQDTFRAYSNPTESVQDFIQFLEDNPRYSNALKVARETGDPEAFIRAVHQAGYATDPAWSDKVLSIARRVSNTPSQTGGMAAARPQGPAMIDPEQTYGDKGSTIVRFGEANSGGRYVYGGGRDRSGLGVPGATAADCSAYVSGLFRAEGVELPAHTDAAYQRILGLGPYQGKATGRQVSAEDAKPGDVVFYLGAGTGGAIAHHMGVFHSPGKVLDMSAADGRGAAVRDIGHAGRFVILRDERLNGSGAPPSRDDWRKGEIQQAPPIVESGVAEQTGGGLNATFSDSDRRLGQLLSEGAAQSVTNTGSGSRPALTPLNADEEPINDNSYANAGGVSEPRRRDDGLAGVLNRGAQALGDRLGQIGNPLDRGEQLTERLGEVVGSNTYEHSDAGLAALGRRSAWEQDVSARREAYLNGGASSDTTDGSSLDLSGVRDALAGVFSPVGAALSGPARGVGDALGATGRALDDAPVIGGVKRALGATVGPVVGAGRLGAGQEQILNEQADNLVRYSQLYERYQQGDESVRSELDSLAAQFRSAYRENRFAAAERNPELATIDMMSSLTQGFIAAGIAPSLASGAARNLAAAVIDPAGQLLSMGIERTAGLAGRAAQHTATAGGTRPGMAVPASGIVDQAGESGRMMQDGGARGVRESGLPAEAGAPGQGYLSVPGTTTRDGDGRVRVVYEYRAGHEATSPPLVSEQAASDFDFLRRNVSPGEPQAAADAANLVDSPDARRLVAYARAYGKPLPERVERAFSDVDPTNPLGALTDEAQRLSLTQQQASGAPTSARLAGRGLAGAVPGAVAGGYEASQEEDASLGSVALGALQGAGAGAARRIVGRNPQALGRVLSRVASEGDPAEKSDWTRYLETNAPELAPPSSGRTRSARTWASSVNNPQERVELHYEVQSLDDLVTSHSDAATMTMNPSFPQELQPRLRSRAGSRDQVNRIAADLSPDALLVETHALDRGAPIIGPDAVVESGNGRTLALKLARDQYPERWSAYQRSLQERAQEFGIDPAALAGVRDPVLVRVRDSAVDRAAFASEANQAAILEMSPFEKALGDAKRVTPELMASLTVPEGATIDRALTAASNREVVRQFMASVPANERAALMTATGELNGAGLERFKNALLARTYPGEAGRRLAETFVESLDPGIKNVESGVFASLPAMARAEGLIQAGERAADLSITDDLSKAADVLARLRQEGISVPEYLSQAAMFERELSPLQEQLLSHLDGMTRSAKAIREFVTRYADEVEAQPHPEQGGLFGEVAPVTKGELVDRASRGATAAADAEPRSSGQLFAQPGATAAEAAPTPAPRAGLEEPGSGAVSQEAGRPGVAPRAGLPKPTRVEQELDSGLILPGRAAERPGPRQIYGPDGEVLSTVARADPAPGAPRSSGPVTGVARSSAGAEHMGEISPETLARLPNLNKIKAPHNVVASMVRTAEENPDLIDRYRRGTITHQELVNDLAPRLGMTAEQFLKSPVGKAFNETEMLFLRASVVQKQSAAVAMAREISERGGVDALTPDEQVQAMSTLLDAARMQAVGRGAGATAGRTLNSMKIVIDETMAQALVGANEKAAAEKAIRTSRQKADKARDAIERLTGKRPPVRDAPADPGVAAPADDQVRNLSELTTQDRAKPSRPANPDAELAAEMRALEKEHRAARSAEDAAAREEGRAWSKEQRRELMEARKALREAEHEELSALRRQQFAEVKANRARGRQLQQAQRALEAIGGKDVTMDVLKQFVQLQESNDPLAMAKFLRGMGKPSAWQRVDAIHYGAMLSSTATHLTNALSNTLQVGVDVALKPVAVGLDKATSAVTGGPRTRYMAEMGPQMRGLVEGGLAGWREAGIVLRHGIDPRTAGKLDQVRPGFGSGNEVVDFAAELPLRALAAADLFFRGAARGGNVRALATRRAIQEGYDGAARVARAQEIVENVTEFPELLALADATAARAVLQESRKQTEGLLALRRQDGATGFLIGLAMPFVRTPVNIAAQGAGMTPAGLMGVISAARKGDRGEAVDRAARAAFGTAVMGGAFSLGLSGGMTAGYPPDPTESSTLPPGWQPWSLRLPRGDGTATYVGFQNLGPVSIPLALGAMAGEIERKGGKVDPVKLAFGAGKFMVDQTFLRGVADVLNAWLDHERYAERVTENIATQFMPYGSLQRQVTRALDMGTRDPEGALEALLAINPITAGQVPAKRNALGDPVKPAQTGAAAFVSPLKYDVEKSDPVLQAFRDAGVGIPRPPEDIPHPQMPNRRIPLNRDERVAWHAAYGKAIRELYQARVGTGAQPDERRLELILSDARERAHREIRQRIGSQEIGRRSSVSVR